MSEKDDLEALERYQAAKKEKEEKQEAEARKRIEAKKRRAEAEKKREADVKLSAGTPSAEDRLQAAAAAAPKLVAEHTVQSGDTLSDIAMKYYKYATRRHYMFIYNTNKDVIGKDPDKIQVGMELKIRELPERLKGDKASPPEGVTVIAEHTVASGETLTSIAQKYYNDASEAAWMTIYEANKDEIGDNPNVIFVGMHFFIPQYP
jgi:nucleoid-associated protein YgaU